LKDCDFLPVQGERLVRFPEVSRTEILAEYACQRTVGGTEFDEQRRVPRIGPLQRLADGDRALRLRLGFA
jgi:hypothetical protein